MVCGYSFMDDVIFTNIYNSLFLCYTNFRLLFLPVYLWVWRWLCSSFIQRLSHHRYIVSPTLGCFPDRKHFGTNTKSSSSFVKQTSYNSSNQTSSKETLKKEEIKVWHVRLLLLGCRGWINLCPWGNGHCKVWQRISKSFVMGQHQHVDYVIWSKTEPIWTFKDLLPNGVSSYPRSVVQQT